MSLPRRLLLPVAAAGTLSVVWVLLGWLPGEPVAGTRYALAAVVGIGVIALLLLGGRAADSAPGRLPAGSGGKIPSVPGGDPARAAQGVAALERKLEQREADLEQALGRCRDAESRLKEAEQRYALAVRSASDGLWEWNIQSGTMYLSPRWNSMLGFAEDEIEGSREGWLGRIHPEDRADAEKTLEAHLRGEATRYEHQHRLLHKDGRVRWVLSRGAAIRHASGKPYRVIGLDTDVTRIRRVESVLREMVEGTSGAWGEALFRCMVQHFAHALEVPFAFVTECTESPPRRVRTLAAWKDRGFVDNFEYDLAGTPCEGVVEGSTCFYPRGLSTLFPREKGWESFLGVPIRASDGRILGHLAFFDRREIPDELLVDAIFKVFAARAGAEMERLRALHRAPAPAALSR